ncbi:hypothetical protein CAEBREN_22856 [Caenorhabditis brenneri]|uniref:Uncharacterized protein n=1 Tax=Caenorhabditis brenneri TaxID=135651 RepID=G0NB18_CAEBE|nr:hypothetical protein CAEBREN_22856 [Caenorhabditis brenneri]
MTTKRSIVETVVKTEKLANYESSIIDEIMNLKEKVEKLTKDNLTNKETSLDLLKMEDALKEDHQNMKKYIEVRMQRDRDDKKNELETMERDFEWSIQKRQKKSTQ